MTVQLHNIEGLQLVHIGLVCRDIDAAKARLSETLGVHWVGVEREPWPLVIFGETVSIPLRIAHASSGQANFELIEAVPDTPWVTSADLIQHHMCFHSSDSEAVCKQFEGRGFERVLGAPGDPQGYFEKCFRKPWMVHLLYSVSSRNLPRQIRSAHKFSNHGWRSHWV